MPRKPKPFTVDHFRRWARELVLDNGEQWRIEDFQAEFVEDLFAGGGLGRWLYAEAWFIVPEGNGKTTLLSGLGLYHCEHIEDAWVPVGAASRDQARILYRQGKGFVVRTPRLAAIFRCYDGYRRIAHRTNGSQIEVFAADSDTADGVIPTLCLIDEPHRHRDMSLYRTWSGKLDKRGGQVATISTAGVPGSEFETTRERIRQEATEVVRRGAFGRFVAGGVVMHEWALPEGGDPDDMRQVKAANPFSGITIAKLRAKRKRPTMTLSHWKRFTCNVPTRSENAAITEAEWEAARTTERIPAGVPIWLGLDVAWKWDTTAAVPLLFRSKEDRLLGPATILTPPRDGSSLDPTLVERALLRIHRRNPIHTVVMDTSRAEQLATWIAAELGATVVDRTQSNANAADDFDRFMEALRQGWLKHPGDPGLTRHALNAIARDLPGGRTRFDRPSTTRQGGDQERRVIDGLTAAAMANSLAAIRQRPARRRLRARCVSTRRQAA